MPTTATSCKYPTPKLGTRTPHHQCDGTDSTPRRSSRTASLTTESDTSEPTPAWLNHKYLQEASVDRAAELSIKQHSAGRVGKDNGTAQEPPV